MARPPIRPALRRAATATATLLLALTCACETHRPPDELARAVETGERPVAMRGDAPFFDGTLSAAVTISRGIGKGFHGPQGGHVTDYGHGSRPNRSGVSKAEMPDLEDMDQDEAMDYANAKVAVGSPLPPVTLRLHIHNASPAASTVEAVDFNSDLGDFVVTPAPLSVPAGGDAQFDPMISQLGVGSDDIPVTVTLRAGKRKETRVILVHNLLAPPPAPPAPPAR